MIKKILLLFGLLSLFWLQAQSPGGVSTNLQRWYRADGTTTVVSGAVSQWNDMSGNNVHLTQATAANRPAQNTSGNLINFNPSLSFDGTNDNLRNATGAAFITGNGGYTAYYVASSGGSASRYIIGLGASASANGFNSGTAATATSKTSGGTAFVTVAGTWSSTPSITRTGFNGGATQPYYLSSNSSAESTSANATPNVAANAPLTIGARPDGTTNYWNGAVSEVIWYSGKHAAADYNRVESYLALKYGITKAGNYINSASATVWTSGAGYDNNIAGIARDDMGGAANSGLNQKQSQSQNSGIQPVIGNVDIAASNAANTNNFTPNLSSLLWGSDAGSTSFTTSFPFGNLNNRMARIWRVQETGTVGTVKVALAASDLSGSITIPTLLVSSDAVFDGSDTRTAMTLETLGGIQYYTATVDFTSGQFFTFGAFVAAPGGVNGNLQAWVKADAGVSTISGAVSSWNDQSGNGNNFSEATNRPVYNTAANLINFNPGISFNGSNHQLTNSTFAINQSGASIFAIGKMDAISSSWQSITASGTAASGCIFRVAGSVLHYKRYASNPSQYTLTAPTVLEAATPYLFETHSATGANNSNLYINGRLDISGTTSVIPTPGLFTSIGVKYVETTGDYFQGSLPEIIYYSSVLNATERARVESYLALKYGTTLGTTSVPVSYLATNGTVTWTGNATYQNNIAGIARDDASALNQKQSQSQNSGIQPVIGNGNIFDTNANNTNNFSADLSALVWGSDTGSTNFATSFVFGGLNNRMTRIWRVQETGTVGTVKVALLATDLPPNAASPALVVSADAVFDGTDTRTTMTLETLGGIQYYTATVDFTTGQFFTFAALVTAPGGVSGSSLWYKADAGITQSSGFVTQWNNQASSSYNLVQQGAAGTIPAYNDSSNLINFNPAVNFDGTNDRLYTPAVPQSVTISGSNPYATSQYIVYRQLSGSNTLYSHSDGSAGTWNIGSFISNGGISVSNRAVTTSTPATNEVRLQGMDGNSNAASSYLNGTLISSTLSAATAVAGTQPFWLGANGTNGFSNAAIAEVIAYNTAQPTNRRRVESYLAFKYGITLGSTSSVVNYLASDGTTILWTGDTTYQNNIAGIARDDASALNQKQSQSQNSGIQPVIGNGNIFDTNANNTNNFSADLSALVWGSDTGSTNFATSFVFGGLNNRMTRIWRVQETGTVGTVKVALLATDLPPNAASPALVVSADAVFDGTDTRTTMTLETLGGIQYYTATVDFTTGQFFTFAALVTAPGGISAELWLKADTGTSSIINGSGISQWNDQSGNSNNVAQGTAGNQPSYFSSASQLVNFNPVVKFDGTNDELIINSLPASASTDNTLEVVAVGFTTDTSLQAISHHGPITDNSQVELLMDGTTDIVLRENCASCSNSAASYTTITGGIPSIVGFNLTNGTTNLNALNVYKNLRVLSSPTVSISGAANITSTTLIVGSRRDDANVRQNPFNGSIPEYIIFQQPLSSLERARVYSYAAIKYGVTLDQTTANNYLASDGTTILWNGTSNAAYNKNIAGLGRDNLSALYQKQSQSVNTGSQVVMALGTAAASNQANANTIPTDKQFFIWGDDNGSLSNIIVTGNATYPYRFTRVWKTQNTGSFAENMTVYYPISAFGNAPASTVALLYGTSATSLGNGTASAIVQSGTTAINGVSYYAFTVPSAQVANIQFFSFTGTQTAPGGVIGANLWLKADTGTSTITDGVDMSQWDDQSGNVNNVSQAIAANRPLYRSNSANQMNFNPTVSFDGASDFMDAATFTINGSANTLFSAVKPNVVNVTQDILSFGAVGTNNGGEFRFVNATLQYGQNNGTFVPIASGSVLTAGTPLLFGSSMENAANGANLYQNNRNITTGTIAQIPSAANLVSIGSRTIGSRNFYFNGFIPEVITYNSLLTAAQRQRVNTYLAIKYGITMDQTAATDYLASDGTTIFWDAATNSGYNNNIAGISRDDFSALNQKQSQSVNSGIQPVIGNVNIAATNAANANNFSADLSALVWGSDTGSTSFAASFVFGGLNNRMTRIWKVQETGTVNTVKVALPVSQLAPNVSQLNLVVSSDAVFDGTDTRTAMTLETLGGVQYYTATVDFTSGQFFTFAALVTAPGGVVNSLTAWLRADNGTATTTNGAANNSWTNLVDGSVSNGGTATYSSNNINFNPGLSFNGTSNGYFWNVTGNWGLQGAQNFSTFALLRTTSSSTQTYFSPWVTGSTQFYLSSGNSGLYATDIAPVVIGSAAINDGIPRITGANRSGNFFQIRTNSANDGAPVNNAYSFASTATQLGVGYHLGTGQYFNGNINEFITYAGSLSATEQQRINSYLAIKYGITLNQSVAQNYLSSNGITVLWDATANTGYNNNIAGIVRDDASALYQKQSQSVNSGSQVVMAIGMAAASNQANANTITADKQFLIWGDDNGSITSIVSTGNGIYSYRLTRIWKTQNTGSFAENITVYYPVSTFGNALPATVALLYGTSAASLSNGTASAIAQGGTTSINGVSYYAFTVPSAQVANMQFFSFTGTIQTAPGGVTGESMWYKADSGVTVASGVSQWNNFAQSNYNLTQSTVANRPTYNTTSNLINFNPSITFDGTSDYLKSTGNPAIGTTSSSLFVLSNDNVATGTIYSATDATYSNNAKQAFYSINTQRYLYEHINPTQLGYLSNVTTMSGASVKSNVYTSGSGIIRRNGSSIITTYTGTLPTISGVTNIELGARIFNDANDLNYSGQIGEFVYYPTNLNSTNRQRVESYLAIKWGITYTQNYLASDGTTTTYDIVSHSNNIAGIGRDDLSALYQKQSQSVNSGSQVVMALGTAAANNQANANTIATDKQFFIWGDDNGSITSIVSTGNGTYSYRLTRIWKAQNTGSFAENITVYYPVAAFGSAPASTVALLYGTSAASLSNGTASAIAQSGTTSINGTSYYAFTVPSAQVANMQFFSFTGTQTAPGGVTGESLWLRADAGTNTTTNGAAITTWNDQALNPAITTQPTKVGSGNITYATGSMNFNPTINFDGTSGTELTGTTSAASTWSGALTVYGIARANTSGSGSQGIFASGTKGLVYSNNQYFIDAGPGGCATGGTGTVTLGSSNLAMVSYDADVPTATSRSYLNGRYRANFTPGACTASPGTGFEIGGRTTGSQPNRIFNGSIGEVIIYNSQQTGNNLSRLAIESYLGIKYGITLTNDNNNNSTANEIVSGGIREGDYIATDGTVTWSGQFNASYYNNIAGIGRDDLSALYQKQSQSTNAGSQVVIALGAAATSNQANANTIPTDKQFFIWGDDNGSITSILSTGNGTYSYRLTRIWKTQNTGSFAENITVYYPVSAFGNASASTVALLYGTTSASLSNGTASAIAQSGTTTINGTSYYAFTMPSAQVANMQFFSFAGTQTAPGGVMDASLWIRADAGTSTTIDGGSVTTWADQSGKGNNLVQNNSSFKPTYATSAATMLNYNPVVSFDGTQFTNVPFTASEDFTAGMSIFTVHKYLNATADGGLLSLMSGSNSDVIRIGRDNTNNFYALQTYNGFTAGPVINTAAGSLLTGNYNFLNWNQQAGSPGATVTATVSFSGLQQLATSSIVPSISDSRLFSAIGISPNFDYFNGHLPEIILYNRDLSSTQQERVNSYIAIKYGFTLVHNYVASDGTTTTYDVASHSNNIAGIGRDDLSALYQKQSQSQNTGSQVVVALGTVAASNQANANTIPTDKQLFVWGDNNLSLTTFVS
ncbi:beta strand repeat-containing protein, partial [Chryseobacterium profundimaris]